MNQLDSPVTILSQDRAWDLLAGQHIGRLAVIVEGQIELFPVNYVVDGESLVIRTATGTKLNGLTQNRPVTFEVDTWEIDHGYSVVLRGLAAVINDNAELARAEALPLRPWVPTAKLVFVRITASALSARRFDFGRDPIAKYRF
ncbi:MAG: pyridoxamine 5'-phosphate oxidase family protein [Propionibacteriaceae bacterium]|jgi:nitroimidazol reductase NimA-like FMN-containing flavoprotein (pyridoxamine 5'-phosphate oxidase superfamily)|nr:pyridoxamine 5'-phosphate oxidase family protein [Propionibacteriaceae bacterium]